jgi:hypothetical protein
MGTAISPIDDLQWDFIVDRIHKRRCVPFLGAGVNVGSKKREYPGLLLGGALAALLSKKIKTRGELTRLALEYEVRTDREYLVEFLRENLADEKLPPSPALQVLAKLPFPLIITTNYDRLLERALTSSGRDYKRLVQPARGFEDKPETRAQLEKLIGYEGTIVYKIHGTFADDTEPHDRYWVDVTPEVTITEDDYIEFLTTHNSDAERLGVPKAVKALVTPNILLFLGYSLRDWDFRTIYRGLVGRLEPHNKRRSFAVLTETDKYWVDYWEAERITIVKSDVYTFCDELEKRYFSRYPN